MRGVDELRRRSATTLLFLADGESLTVSSASERIALVRYDAVVLDGGRRVDAGGADGRRVFVVDIVNLPAERE